MSSVHMCSGVYSTSWWNMLNATLGSASPVQATTQRNDLPRLGSAAHACISIILLGACRTCMWYSLGVAARLVPF